MLENQPQPRQEKPTTMNAREKSGQGLDYWYAEQYERGRISKKDYEHFCDVNNHKEEEIRKRGLPQLRHYGLFSNVE